MGEAGNAVLTDAAKRDRTVWPGDMAISLPTAYASLFDTHSSKNSLQRRFGSNGQWRTRTASGSSPCNAETFGDPLPNTLKRCEYRDVP